jgi:hypothetical protein
MPPCVIEPVVSFLLSTWRAGLLYHHVSPDPWPASFSVPSCGVGSSATRCTRTHGWLLCHHMSPNLWLASFSLPLVRWIPCHQVYPDPLLALVPPLSPTRGWLPYLCPLAGGLLCDHVFSKSWLPSSSPPLAGWAPMPPRGFLLAAPLQGELRATVKRTKWREFFYRTGRVGDRSGLNLKVQKGAKN